MIRSEAISILNNLRNYYNIRQGGEEYTQALDFAISSLLTDEAYQLEYEQPEFCADCISRAEVLKLMRENWHTQCGDWAMQESMDDIRALPSVTPQEPKTGHWDDIPKYKDIAWRCSECEHFTTMKHNYCPNCGAKMIEPQESEDKE